MRPTQLEMDAWNGREYPSWGGVHVAPVLEWWALEGLEYIETEFGTMSLSGGSARGGICHGCPRISIQHAAT